MSNQKKTIKKKKTQPKPKSKQKITTGPKPDTSLIKYEKFIDTYVQNNEAKMNITKTTNELNAITLDINNNNSYPTSLTDHAFNQICDRLEELSLKYSVVYSYISSVDVWDSLFVPSILRKFVFESVYNAIKNNSVVSKKSRSGGIEYIYNDNMTDIWAIGNNKEITFSIIVENNVVKTGYFNVHDK